MNKFKDTIKSNIQNLNVTNLAKAVLLNEKVRKKAPAGFNSTDIIRKFREKRH